MFCEFGLRGIEFQVPEGGLQHGSDTVTNPVPRQGFVDASETRRPQGAVECPGQVGRRIDQRAVEVEQVGPVVHPAGAASSSRMA